MVMPAALGLPGGQGSLRTCWSKKTVRRAHRKQVQVLHAEKELWGWDGAGGGKLDQARWEGRRPGCVVAVWTHPLGLGGPDVWLAAVWMLPGRLRQMRSILRSGTMRKADCLGQGGAERRSTGGRDCPSRAVAGLADFRLVSFTNPSWPN